MMRRLALAAAIAFAPVAAHAQFATIGPTPAVSDNGDRLATTAWVNNFFALGIPLSSGKIFVGSAGNIATQQTPSGDCTLSITGVITCTQAAGNFTVVGNLSVGGAIIDANGILATNIAAPATPAAGTTRIYVDSTTKVLTFKNDAGTVGNAVVPLTCAANQFGVSVSAAGVFGCAQPAITNISGLGTGVATFLGAASSANMRAAITDETGTGLAYFQGGDIGTPSAGVGTNLTALNASNLGSGTVPAARMPALTGDVTMTAGTTATTLAAGSASALNSGTVAAARGGAGTINGALKGNGSGVVSQAACADLSNAGALCPVVAGTGVATAAANATNSNGGLATSTGSSTVWTPTITTSGTVGTPAYSTQTAVYEKVGNTVHVYFNIVLSGWTGSPTGNVSIAGLPIAANGSGFGMCNITGYSGVLSIGWVSGVPSASTIILEVIPQTGATGFANLTAANAGTTFNIKGGCTYPP